MKRNAYLITVFVGLALALGVVGGAMAQDGGPVSQAGVGVQAALGAGFTYQGQLKSSGSPVNDSCTFGFGLWDSSSGGAQLGVTQTVTTTVTGGLFTVTLSDSSQFGSSAFSGSNARYLGIGVKCGSESNLTNLGRQALAAAPYALYARNNWGLSGNSGTSVSNFLGTTSNMTLTLAVSNTAVLRLVPNVTSPNIIGGWNGNHVSSGVSGATIGGGGASGYTNTVSGNYGTVSGGVANTASNTYATVGGGVGNTASGQDAIVGGGLINKANNQYATVGGGSANTASGYAATVSGGTDNTAGGDYSFAAGQHAQALHDGAFVWADDSTTTPITSTAINQFVVRSANGVSLTVNAGASKAIDVGEHYRDNAIIAWGKVTGSNGAISADFGVLTVTHSSTGNYLITLEATTASAAQLVPVANVELDAPAFNATDARFIYIDQQNTTQFRVYITNGNYIEINNDFTFIVTGR